MPWCKRRDERAAYRKLLKTATKALEDAALVLKRARTTSLELRETVHGAVGGEAQEGGRSAPVS